MLFCGKGGFEPSSSSSNFSVEVCRPFKYRELERATKKFHNSLLIGKGSFGNVYRATVSNGSTNVDAAIKRMDSMSKQGSNEYLAEVKTLSKSRHCNIVSLIGYCRHKKEMIIVYEYMPNGTLRDHLFKSKTPLTWIQRLQICIGVGSGLHYLHTGTKINMGITHRDVKTSNILLDENLAAKISDFGLCREGPTNQLSTSIDTCVKGSFGYMDPYYQEYEKLSRKSDVYSFGVVLLEVLCRKPAVDTSKEEWVNLASLAKKSIQEGMLEHIIDPELSGEISPESLDQFVEIAKKCLIETPKERPTMAEVVVDLQSILTSERKIISSLPSAGVERIPEVDTTVGPADP